MARRKIDLPVSDMVREYEVGGMSIRRLCKKYGVGVSTIHDRLVKAGANMRESGVAKLDTPSGDFLLKLQKDSGGRVSLTELAKRYGVSRSTIDRRIKEAQSQGAAS